MSHTVVGLFNDSDKARKAVEKLVDDGFENSNIDCSFSRTGTTTGAADTDRRDHESGIEKFFRNLFGDDDHTAEKYSRAGRNNTVVTVHATSDYEAKRAADLLDDFGAIDVDEDEASYTSDNYRAASDATADRRDTDTTRKIPVVEENLEVGKRNVETGGVRVRSRVIEKPVEENLRLREERVSIERKPVDRNANASDLETFRDKEIEMTERKEVPIVNKEARVTEEITVNKETDVRNETVRDTLKKTEVDVENLGKNRISGDGNL